MQHVLPWLLALAPAAFAPGVSFYFEVIPKVSILMLTVAILLFARDLPSRFRQLCLSRFGCWFCLIAAAQSISLLVATLYSTHPWLSLNGSSWRRFGLITQLALILMMIVLAVDLFRRRDVLQQTLRAFTLVGLVVAVYGILQYFGFDPLLDKARYHVGEGVWMIVRPPGTLGHANYFAVYLLMVAFSAAAVRISDHSRLWRTIGGISIAIASAAIVLSGTRAALIGGLAGITTVACLMRPRLRLKHAALGIAVVSCIAVFYFSPAGERLRARVRWSMEDVHGGARLWLWRDTIQMAAERPALGFGPETFGVEFPPHQSLDLSRAYPDFQHESPHNVVLHALIDQGVPGVITLLGFVILGVAAGYRALPNHRKLAAIFLGCLAALFVSQQFFALTVATATCLYMTIAILVALRTAGAETDEAIAPRSIGWTVARAAAAFLFVEYAITLTIADRSLARTRDRLAANDIPGAATEYEKALSLLPPGASADLYYSRAMAAKAASAREPLSAVQAWQQATTAGERALRTSDEPANAAYSLAALYAARNDLAGTERCLRNAIAISPNWFKPHWMLAQVLMLAGRQKEAELAAMAAVERNGNKNPEVVQTLNRIQQNVPAPR